MRRMRYYTPRQVAELLQLTPQVIYEYIKAGKLPAIRLGTRYRISAEDLDRFLEASKMNVGDEAED
jgi:excisionase family DNA binding protein